MNRLKKKTLETFQAVARGGLSAAIAAALLVQVVPAAAHESEQYTLPVGRDFADLGPYLSRIVFTAIEAAVNETNRSIKQAIDSEQGPQRIAELQAPDTIANNVWGQLFLAIPTNELLDINLLSQDIKAQYPGLVTMHRPTVSIYDDPLLVIDLTKAVRTFFRAGTINAGGTLFGTDKLIHFINVGKIYHTKYQSRIEQGKAEGDAAQGAIRSAARNPLTSEDGMLGMFTTGIHSNGDLAADFAGLKFYRNLTEPVRIGTRELPPMLVRDGPYWRVQAQPDSDFFTVFITPHWNEVLNPNRYARYFSARLRTLISQRCPDALDHYRDEHGRIRSAAEFDAIARDLSTYYGEPYGYATNSSPVNIRTACFTGAAPDRDAMATPASPAPAAASVNADSGAPTVDAFGRSALWWAARRGDAVTVARLATPSDVNAADVDGETPLHAAVRAGSAPAVRALLAADAKADAIALYGVSPLMLTAAPGRPDIAVLLLQAGADPNARDLFGQTALLNAVARGSNRVALILLEHHADPQAPDDAGNTPLHVAARRGDAAVVAALLARGADPRARNALGASPSDDATRAGHSTTAAAIAAAAGMNRRVAMSSGSDAARDTNTEPLTGATADRAANPLPQ